jgi:hypothetical protein
MVNGASYRGSEQAACITGFGVVFADRDRALYVA